MTPVSHHVLNVAQHMSGRDEEMRRDTANVLVLAGGHPNQRHARRGRALAEELHRLVRRGIADLSDPLVHLAEQRLVAPRPALPFPLGHWTRKVAPNDPGL